LTFWLLKMFVVALILTFIIELTVAFFLGIRCHKVFLLILLVNIFTNPPAVLLYWLGSLYFPKITDLGLQLGIEFAVIIIEALIYHCFSTKKKWNLTHPILLSIELNICSWSIGLFLL